MNLAEVRADFNEFSRRMRLLEWLMCGVKRTSDVRDHNLRYCLETQGIRVTGSFGSLVSLGSLGLWGLWVSGSLGLLGSLGLWVSGSLGLWVSGSLGLWVSGSLGLWVSGSLGLWVSGVSGSLGLWVYGVSGSLGSLGSLGLWVSEPKKSRELIIVSCLDRLFQLNYVNESILRNRRFKVAHNSWQV